MAPELLADEVRAAALIQGVGCEPFHREILSIEHTPGLHGPRAVNPVAGGPSSSVSLASVSDHGAAAIRTATGPTALTLPSGSSSVRSPANMSFLSSWVVSGAQDGERQELRIVRVARAVPPSPVQQLFDGGAELPRARGTGPQWPPAALTSGIPAAGASCWSRQFWCPNRRRGSAPRLPSPSGPGACAAAKPGPECPLSGSPQSSPGSHRIPPGRGGKPGRRDATNGNVNEDGAGTVLLGVGGRLQVSASAAYSAGSALASGAPRWMSGQLPRR